MKVNHSKYVQLLYNVIGLFALLFLCESLYAQNNKLDLSFENFNSNDRSQWIATNDPRLYMFIDTVNVIEGKQSIVLADGSARINPVNDFISALFQYIELPDSVRKIDLSVFSKTRQVGDVWMKVYLINEHGILTSRDSVSLISKEWNESHISISSKQSTFVYLEIFMHNKHDKDVKDKKDTIPILWVDNIQIKLDAKDISTYPESKNMHCSMESRAVCNPIPLNTNSWADTNSIKNLQKHRFFAFGETVHTSNEVQHFFTIQQKN